MTDQPQWEYESYGKYKCDTCGEKTKEEFDDNYELRGTPPEPHTLKECIQSLIERLGKAFN